jgi:chloramphenicol 3-O phosphotransferase
MIFAPDHRLDPKAGRFPGQIVILNGTSCSGKSTTAQALVGLLEPNYVHLGIDMFRTNRPLRLDRDGQRLHTQRLVFGFHRAVAGFAAGGNNVVMDHLLGEQWRVRDIVTVFADYDVVLVGVHCGLDELRRREQARNNRVTGRAESQLASIHANLQYDIEIDTSVMSSHECAAAIADYLATGHGTRAISRLAAH